MRTAASTARYPVHVVRIITPSTVEMEIHLGFGVSIRKKACLSAVPVVPDAQWEAAKHCLIVMAGGKDAVAECDATMTHPIINDVLLLVPAVAPPVEFASEHAGSNLLNVCAVMQSLATKGFDVDTVRQYLNRRT